MLASWLPSKTFIIEPRLAWERIKSIAMSELVGLAEGKHLLVF